MKARIRACLIEISPDAIGLDFLMWCRRSDSTSKMSLIMYPKEAVKENAQKPCNTLNSASTEYSSDRQRGANKRRFFM